MDDMTNQDMMSFVSPPEGVEEVTAYIADVVRALGGRNDADLARTMGIPAATVANWKRRGRITDDGALWLTTTLVEKIFAYRDVAGRIDQVAGAGVIEAIIKADGDILDLGAIGRVFIGKHFAALLTLAQFVVDRGANDECMVAQALMTIRSRCAAGRQVVDGCWQPL